MKIEVRNMSKTFFPNTEFEKKALNNITFIINPGDFIAIVGKTGSGKSTLASLLTGISKPTDGSIFYEGIGEIFSNSKKKSQKGIPEKIAMTFQSPNLQLFKTTIISDVSFALENKGISKEIVKEKAEKTLLNLGLGKEYWNRSPFQLSEGEKRKVILAAILIADPKVIIFDEPTANLDEKTRLSFLEIIKELNKKGKTIIMISHDTRAVKDYAKKILTLDQGKIKSFLKNKDYYEC